MQRTFSCLILCALAAPAPGQRLHSPDELREAYEGSMGSMFIGYSLLHGVFHVLRDAKPTDPIRGHPGYPLLRGQLTEQRLFQGIERSMAVLVVGFRQRAAGYKLANSTDSAIKPIPWNDEQVLDAGDLCHAILVTRAFVIATGRGLTESNVDAEASWRRLEECAASDFVPRSTCVALFTLMYARRDAVEPQLEGMENRQVAARIRSFYDGYEAAIGDDRDRLRLSQTLYRSARAALDQDLAPYLWTSELTPELIELFGPGGGGRNKDKEELEFMGRGREEAEARIDRNRRFVGRVWQTLEQPTSEHRRLAVPRAR